MSDRLPGGGAPASRLVGVARMSASASSSDEPGRLVRGEHDPGALATPAADGGADGPDGHGRQRRLVPAERVATRRRALRLALPGQPERPAVASRCCPVARVRDTRPASPWAARPTAPGRRAARPPVPTGRSRRPRCPPARPAATGRPRHGRAPWPGASRPPQVSAASPSVPVSSDARSAASRSGSAAGSPCPAAARSWAPVDCVSRNSLAGSRRRGRDRADAPLVGRIEGAHRLDLVAEPLHPDRQRLAGREEVHDAAASGHLAPAADLGHLLVAQVDEGVQHPVLGHPLAGPQHQRILGHLGGRQRPLEQRLDRRDQDARRRVRRGPRRERRDTRRALVPDQLRALPGERRSAAPG